QTKPERKYVGINEIINTTLDLRAYSLRGNNVQVVLQLDPDLPMTVADPSQLQQVFLNLVINAETEVKSVHGGGKLAIKTEQIDNNIRISFKDSGPGIAKENLERIFNPFFTTRTTRKVGQGTGLGLSLCHGVITEHKGRIWAESQLGKGATFIVELPIVAEDRQLETPEPVVQEARKVVKAKILVVDDETVISQFVSQILTDEGHEVEAVDSAEDALEKVKSEKYQIIMLDIKMPGMSGIELYRRFRKTSPTLAEGVVFITGDVMGASTMDFLNKTKVPYIIKPFDARQLKTEINRVLAKG
ncbi:ATP-binding protein, partial [Chloroflexota bacterium]